MVDVDWRLVIGQSLAPEAPCSFVNNLALSETSLLLLDNSSLSLELGKARRLDAVPLYPIILLC